MNEASHPGNIFDANCTTSYVLNSRSLIESRQIYMRRIKMIAS